MIERMGIGPACSMYGARFDTIQGDRAVMVLHPDLPSVDCCYVMILHRAEIVLNLEHPHIVPMR